MKRNSQQNDSQIEDGSSGGEATITKNMGAGSGENAPTHERSKTPER